MGILCVVAYPSRMAKRVISSVQNGLNVTYDNGNWTNRLSGDYLTLEETEDGITLAMDMVSNQEAQSADTVHDVDELLEDIANVKFVQVSEKDAVQGIGDAMFASPLSVWTLELNFLNGATHRLRVGPHVDEPGAFLFVLRG